MMTTRSALVGLLVAAALAAPPARGEPAPASAAGAPTELSIVVVDSLRGNSSDINNFDRIARVFTEVFTDRKWPCTISVERFAANTPPHPTELRIFFQGMREESLGDLTFSAWMILYDHGAKQDFGVVRFRYDTRPMEQMSDRMDRSVRGAARIAAEKIEPILFPKGGKPKP